MKILVNDGMHNSGIEKLKASGFEVSTDKISQDDLMTQLNEFDAICVRSATKVRKELIDASPNLKAIGRGGVGLDNIDVDYAKSKGIGVFNTPAASSRSVAELAMAHMLSLSRFLYSSNRQMPVDGRTEFKSLKKSFSKGTEIGGKTLGIVGFGRIGQETARLALGMGMDVLPVDPYIDTAQLEIGPEGSGFEISLETVEMDQMLEKADFISLHIPFLGKAVLDKDAFSKMKKGVFVINAARGGTIDEDALLEALQSEVVAAAALDVFEQEPTPRQDLLDHPRISLTPHIGASTGAAQEKIGIELADKLIAHLKG